MADIVTSRQFTDGERGITAQKLNDIVGSSTIQPAFYSSKPTAPTADPADIALILKAGAYAQVPISSLAGSATQAQIWATRLRSFNAIGNPNFEMDQRNVGAGITLATGSATGFVQDRWFANKAGTMVATGQQVFANTSLPGTNFRISQSLLRINIATAQASLGAGDLFLIQHFVEGPNWRELSNDVHSISILARANVPVKFGISLRDTSPTQSLTKLCTIPTANTWTLITLPNLPVFPGGNFSVVPGNLGYNLYISLACGSTYASPANDSWQSGNFLGATGQDNFFSNPVNSNIDFAFIQHEPGPLCTTLMDKPFSQNLDECLRYYCKSYPYTTKQGTASMAVGQIVMYASNASFPLGTVRFPKAMAKTPSVVVYDPTGGGSNNVRNFNMATAVAATAGDISDQGFDNVNTPSGVTVGQQILLHYAADTGW